MKNLIQIATCIDFLRHRKSQEQKNIFQKIRRCGIPVVILALGFASNLVGGGKALPENTYVIIASEKTIADPNWRAVATAIEKKYPSRVQIRTYSGDTFTDALREQVAALTPRYVCFLAKPEELSRAYIAHCHVLIRHLDEDVYGDAVWGIITGYTYKDALKVAEAKPFQVSNGLLKTGGGWLDYLESGTCHSEDQNNAVWIKTKGGAIDKRTDGPEDDTGSLVESLNANKVDIMVTSGHATEYDWQLHYPTPNPEGFFKAGDGQLYGEDGQSVKHNINSSNPKIYYGPGNCLIGNIPEQGNRNNCMVLGWLGSGGAVQFAGYTVTSWFGYMGWGVADYFLRLGDRFTFAESVFLNNQSLLFDLKHDTPNSNKTGLEYDQNTFVLYGDPALNARLKLVKEPDYRQKLSYTTRGNVTEFTFTIKMMQEFNPTRLAAEWLPRRISNPRVVQNDGLIVEVTDDMVLVQLWKPGDPNIAVGKTWTIKFTGNIDKNREK